jgi:ankyrin repeat protein
VGRFSSSSLVFTGFMRKMVSLMDSDKLIPYGLSVLRAPRTCLDRAADALVSWLSLSKVPLSDRGLEEVFSNFLRTWKNSAIEEGRSSSTQNDISLSGSETLDARSVLQRCEPYVTVDRGNGLVHFSSAGTEQIAAHVYSKLTKVESASSVAKSCLEYLDSTENFAKGRCATDVELANMLQTHAFLEHAVHFGFYLAIGYDIDSEGHEDVDEKVLRLLNSPKRFLVIQVFLYTNKEDLYQDTSSLSWGQFSNWVDSMSPLHVASRWGLPTIVKALLKEGKENARRTDSHSSISLHKTAESGIASVVQARLKDNIVSVVDDKGKTPVFYAWRGGHRGALVLLFEAHCAFLTIKDLNNIGGAIKDLGNISGTGLDNLVQKYCLAKSELPNGTDEAKYMGTALIRAIEGKLEVVAALLIHRGVDPNAEHNGKSALDTAVQHGQDNLAALLVSKGAEPPFMAPEGLEPVLHIAVRKRLRLTVQALLKSRSVYVNCQDSEGRTALFAAMETDDNEWAMEATRLLLWNRLDVDLYDNNHCHIMHIVAKIGYSDVFSDLIFKSSLVEEPRDNNGQTPFEIALKHGNKGIACLLRPYEMRSQGISI